MANAKQIKALIKSHYTSDSDRFTTLALQIAAYEASNGHPALAIDIKNLVSKGRKDFTSLRILPTNDGLSDFLQVGEPSAKLSDMVASSRITTSLKRIIEEFVQRSELKKHGLKYRRKTLLTGPPGTGKAMTASAIAHELELPLYIIHTDKIITEYMDETVFKLKQVFDFINQQMGVYFFDEFDTIGAERAKDNNVGETRCVLNSFLQFLKQDKSGSFIIAATNHFTLLDKTLLQSFDDVLFYELPKYNEALKLIRKNLASFPFDFKLEMIMEHTVATLSHSEIRHVCEDAIKIFILSESPFIKKTVLLDALAARKR